MSSLPVLSTAVTSAPIVFGKLHCKCPDAPTGAVDQYLLSAADISLPDEMQGFQSSDGHGGSFLEGHIGRFDRQHPFLRVCRQAGVFGIGAQAKTGRPKDLVAFFEPLYIPANRSTSPASSCPRMVIRLGLRKPT